MENNAVSPPIMIVEDAMTKRNALWASGCQNFSRKEDFPTTSHSNHLLSMENNVVSPPIMIVEDVVKRDCIA